MEKYRLQLKLKDGQSLGYIQMDNGKPYYDYGYLEATLFDPIGVLNLLNKIPFDKYDVFAEVPYTTNKGRKGKTALKNEELKTYMKSELGKAQIMENKTMNDYKIQLEDGVFVEVNSADYTDLVDANFETSIGDYGVARNPQTGVTIIGAVPGDVYYKAFEMRTITLDDVKDALDSVSDGFYAFLGVEPAEYDGSLTEENLANAIMDLNQYEGYFQPAVFEMPQGLAEDGIVAIEEEPVAESKNESLDEVANTKAKSLNGKKVMFDDLGNPVTPEEWAEGIANGTINEAFRLSKSDKEYLKSIGNDDEDLPQIEKVGRSKKTKFELDDTEITSDEAIKVLGKEKFLAGLSRCAFHKSAKQSNNGKSVHFVCESVNENNEFYFDDKTERIVTEKPKNSHTVIKTSKSLEQFKDDFEKAREEGNSIADSITIAEAFESDDDLNALALIDYLVSAEGENEDEIADSIERYNDNEYSTPVGDYYVFPSYEEAEQAAVEYEKQILDDIGIDALNWNYMPYEIGHYVNRDWFQAAMEESNQFYIDDIREEGDRLAEEMADAGVETEEEYLEHLNNNYADPIDWYKDNFGEEDFGRIAVEKNLVDLDAIAEAVVETDGPAHALAGYDGNEVEWEYGNTTYYIYRND